MSQVSLRHNLQKPFVSYSRDLYLHLFVKSKKGVLLRKTKDISTYLI